MNEIVTIHNKQYKSVLPCGLLRTQTGHTYFLLHPEPVVKDSWQRDEQQRFVVVPADVSFEEYDATNDRILHTYARHTVTTNPDIEYYYFRTPILIEYLNELDVESQPQEVELDFNPVDFPPPDLSAEEWDKLLEHAEEELA
jgi:hypothetical protein